MSSLGGPNIVTNGLVLSLDAANTKSYTSGSTTWFDKSGITEEVLENYQLPLKIKGWEAAFWEFSRNGVDSIIQDHLAELKIPTMVFAADNDEIILPKYSIAVAELIPNAHLVKLTDCGHIPHEEKPQEFMRAVTDLINQR